MPDKIEPRNASGNIRLGRTHVFTGDALREIGLRPSESPALSVTLTITNVGRTTITVSGKAEP